MSDIVKATLEFLLPEACLFMNKQALQIISPFGVVLA